MIAATVHTGDCLQVMPTMPADHFDSIVTDPPYGLEFMGKDWDAPWKGDMRQPSDADFHKGSGPFSRATVRYGGVGYGGKAATMCAFQAWFEPIAAEMLRVAKPGAYALVFGGTRTYHRTTAAMEDAGWEIRDCIMWVYGSGFPKSHNGPWGGTALKPAYEPIIMARKPLIGTVVANVLAHGTGALNIDGCRVDAPDGVPLFGNGRREAVSAYADGLGCDGRTGEVSTTGRWPANLIHDGSDDVLDAFQQAPGQQGDLTGHSRGRVSLGIYGDMGAARDAIARQDAGSAARFFYCAKASRADREDGCEGMPTGKTTDGRKIDADNAYQRGATYRRNTHPTVKPTDLMRYLCRLVTPAGGRILDPFTGSGSTGRGAVLEGVAFEGIEQDAGHATIARARIAAADATAQAAAGVQLALAI